MIDPVAFSDQTAQVAADLVLKAEDGDIQSLDVYLALHKLNKQVSDLMSQLKPQAIQEAERFSSKTFDYKGFLVTVKNDPARWVYDECPSVLKKQEELKVIQELAKKAFELGGHNIVTDDGEIIEPAQKINGSTNLSIKLPK